jgi:hypothetical protein
LVILTSGWQPSDSQLAVSSKFIPLIQSLLESTGVGAAPPAQFFVGDPVSLEADSNGGRVVRTPGGRMVTVEKGATTFAETWEPGVYSVEATEAPGRVVRRFAVNVDPQESRTVPMPAETLERFGAPLATAPLAANPPPDRAALLAGAEAEAHQKLWKWVLAGALGFLLLETALAAATGQRSAASMEVQPEGMA